MIVIISDLGLVNVEGLTVILIQLDAVLDIEDEVGTSREEAAETGDNILILVMLVNRQRDIVRLIATSHNNNGEAFSILQDEINPPWWPRILALKDNHRATNCLYKRQVGKLHIHLLQLLDDIAVQLVDIVLLHTLEASVWRQGKEHLLRSNSGNNCIGHFKVKTGPVFDRTSPLVGELVNGR